MGSRKCPSLVQFITLCSELAHEKAKTNNDKPLSSFSLCLRGGKLLIGRDNQTYTKVSGSYIKHPQ